MTNEILKSLIKKLNKNKADELIHLRPLSSTVDFAKVWLSKPKPTDDIGYPDLPDKMYFIKNLEGLYVGAVLDMGRDLHWFVDSKHRRKGHLTVSMKETILSHLFQDRDEQRITIDKFQIGGRDLKSSTKVALALGFENTINEEYYLMKEKYQSSNPIYGINTVMSEERLNVLKKQFNYLSRSLLFIKSEIEMKFGQFEYTDELNYLAREIKDQIYRFEDYWWEQK